MFNRLLWSLTTYIQPVAMLDLRCGCCIPRVALQTLKKSDPRDEKRCLHLRDDFEFNGHLCMVFDVLATSLFDFMEANNFHAFPVEEVQHLAVQLVVAIEYMHSLRLTHTDLKPENVMIDHAKTLKVRAIGRTSPGCANQRSCPATMLAIGPPIALKQLPPPLFEVRRPYTAFAVAPRPLQRSPVRFCVMFGLKYGHLLTKPTNIHNIYQNGVLAGQDQRRQVKGASEPGAGRHQHPRD
jgi:serine/threonine protein kinase